MSLAACACVIAAELSASAYTSRVRMMIKDNTGVGILRLAAMFKRHTVASLSFAFTLIGVLSLHVAAQSHCEETLFPVQASTNNYNLSGLDATPPTTPTRDVAIAGTFVLRFRFCERTERNSSRDDTLLVLSPGATYSSLYWHWPLQPETYNFARFAATNGFHTLSVDRLGLHVIGRLLSVTDFRSRE